MIRYIFQLHYQCQLINQLVLYCHVPVIINTEHIYIKILSHLFTFNLLFYSLPSYYYNKNDVTSVLSPIKYEWRIVWLLGYYVIITCTFCHIFHEYYQHRLWHLSWKMKPAENESFPERFSRLFLQQIIRDYEDVLRVYILIRVVVVTPILNMVRCNEPVGT